MRYALTSLLLAATLLVIAQTRKDYKGVGAPIPPFGIETTGGKLITNAQLQKWKPVIIMIFSPECEHCEHTLDSLKLMAGLFRSTQLLLCIEARNKPLLKAFMAKHEFDKVPLFSHTGWDKGNLIYFIYTYGLLPQFNIYDKQHRLVKTLGGNFPLDSLRMYVK